MPHDSPPNSTHSLELALLRSLCVNTGAANPLGPIPSLLAGYKWHDADHAIVYEALRKVSSRDKRPLREQLPAIATRMGFPDVDWDNYFTISTTIPEQEINEILRKLVASTAPRK
jgi:hypothetical protein